MSAGGGGVSWRARVRATVQAAEIATLSPTLQHWYRTHVADSPAAQVVRSEAELLWALAIVRTRSLRLPLPDAAAASDSRTLPVYRRALSLPTRCAGLGRIRDDLLRSKIYKNLVGVNSP